MTVAPRITVRFFRLSEPLEPYFTALYLTENRMRRRAGR